MTLFIGGGFPGIKECDANNIIVDNNLKKREFSKDHIIPLSQILSQKSTSPKYNNIYSTRILNHNKYPTNKLLNEKYSPVAEIYNNSFTNLNENMINLINRPFILHSLKSREKSQKKKKYSRTKKYNRTKRYSKTKKYNRSKKFRK